MRGGWHWPPGLMTTLARRERMACLPPTMSSLVARCMAHRRSFEKREFMINLVGAVGRPALLLVQLLSNRPAAVLPALVKKLTRL